MPACSFIIFLLLYIVYRNAKEAAHVILAVPFALTGGVFLQYLLGYNFSVAVWVGYIALFGTAIQTGVVMVVYLRKRWSENAGERGAAFNRADLNQRRERRRATALASEGHDRGDDRGQPAADHVEHAHRRRSNEAARHAGDRRDGQQPDPHLDRHAGDFCLAACARTAAIGDILSSIFLAIVPFPALFKWVDYSK